MKRKLLRERGLALLLVLVLALGMVPTAFALNAVCPACHSTNCTVEVVLEANCHEKGIERYVCANCGRTTLQETAINLFNHDAVCVDNGDGLTHTATCRWHPEYANVTEEHRFGSDGRCVKCLAVNYAAVQISLPRNLQTYVAVGDTAAALSLGDVSLTLGGADVTGEYEISYNWYYGGRTVGEGKTYALPAAMTAAEGDYTYVCFLMAVARNNPTSTITASCTVSVLVRDLITADAAVSGDDVFLDMSDTNSRTPSSIMEQIYAGAYDLSVGIPSYVVFGDKPLSKVGNLKSSAGTRYYFQPANASQAALASLRFEPSKGGDRHLRHQFHRL